MPDEFDFIIVQGKHNGADCGYCTYSYSPGGTGSWTLDGDHCEDYQGSRCECPYDPDFPTNPTAGQTVDIKCVPPVPPGGDCRDSSSNAKKCGEDCVNSDCEGLCWWKWDCGFLGAQHHEPCDDGDPSECIWVWKPGTVGDYCSANLDNWVADPDCTGVYSACGETHPCQCLTASRPASPPPLWPTGGDPNDCDGGCVEDKCEWDTTHDTPGECVRAIAVEEWVFDRSEGECGANLRLTANCVCDGQEPPDPEPGTVDIDDEVSSTCRKSDCCDDMEEVAPYNCQICGSHAGVGTICKKEG